MEKNDNDCKWQIKAAYIWKYVVNGITALILVLYIGMQMMQWSGYEPYRILTGSMEPTLITGEIVLINTNDRDGDVGDIIAFQLGEHVVIHRIVEIASNGEYKTKGDANPTEDFDTVGDTEMIGTLWMKLGPFKWFWDLFSSRKKYALIVMLVLMHGSAELAADLTGGEEVEYA